MSSMSNSQNIDELDPLICEAQHFIFVILCNGIGLVITWI